jgi:hypothetical protein
VHVEMTGAPYEILLAGALGSLHELFGPEAEVSGDVRGRYAGREDDTLARLELELELEATVDLGPRFPSCFEDASEDTHGFELAAEVEGPLVLVWDLEARHLRSARFEGDVLLAGRVSFPVSTARGPEPVAFAGDYELSGTVEVELVGD